MDKVRYGVIGLGFMGSKHAERLFSEIEGAELRAVCSRNPERLRWAADTFGDGVKRFGDPGEMFASGTVDAVVIATPHFDHPVQAVNAFRHGLHVLVEKPAGVYTLQAREMAEAAKASGKVYGIMYNQRTNPLYRKLRDLVLEGELGSIRRTNWIITNWYRSQSYYNSSAWRATWAGEGGGVLLNQDLHQLDLWQWTIGMMPKRVRAFCHFGKYRDIEVEDDVTAYVEYENGATGVFVTTTGEAPGTNRFEVTGDNGKIVIEDGKLTFWRLRVPEPEFNRTNKVPMEAPECWKCEIPVESGEGEQHRGILQNFTDAVLHGTPLLAPGEEGIHGLELCNAMLLSTWLDDWVELPLDGDLYYRELKKRMDHSRFRG